MTRQKHIQLEFSETDRAFLRRLRLTMDVKDDSKALRTLIKEADAKEQIVPVTIPTIVTVSIPARTAEIHRTMCVLSDHDMVRLRTLQVKLGCTTRMATIRQLIWDAFLYLIEGPRDEQSNDQSSRETTRRVA